jgi:hypothetical protein
MDIVRDSLEYYDNNIDIINEYIKNIDTIEVDVNNSQIHINYDNKKKKDATFEFLGKYDASSKIWVWSWAIPYFPKKVTNISRRIIKYALDNDMKEKLYLKTELITSRFLIANDIQLDIHKAISSYISRTKILFMISIIDVENKRNICKVSTDITQGQHYLVAIIDNNDENNNNDRNYKNENNQ